MAKSLPVLAAVKSIVSSVTNAKSVHYYNDKNKTHRRLKFDAIIPTVAQLALINSELKMQGINAIASQLKIMPLTNRAAQIHTSGRLIVRVSY
jgi:hypothetical protein